MKKSKAVQEEYCTALEGRGIHRGSTVLLRGVQLYVKESKGKYKRIKWTLEQK